MRDVRRKRDTRRRSSRTGCSLVTHRHDSIAKLPATIHRRASPARRDSRSVSSPPCSGHRADTRPSFRADARASFGADARASSGPLPVHRSGPSAHPGAVARVSRATASDPPAADLATGWLAGSLIAGACVASAAWYVPRVMTEDRKVITGTVSSSGVVALNFAASGQIGKVNVHLDQAVRKGEVLAAEYAPNADSIVTADKAAIAAEQAKIAQLRGHSRRGSGQCRRRQRGASRGQGPAGLGPGPAGDRPFEGRRHGDRRAVCRDQSSRPTASQAKPSPPQASGLTHRIPGRQPRCRDRSSRCCPRARSRSGRMRRPDHRCRSSRCACQTAWQIVALIPEGSVSGIKTGQKVTIDVPTVGINGPDRAGSAGDTHPGFHHAGCVLPGGDNRHRAVRRPYR